MKGIDIIKNLSKALALHSHKTIYKSFVRPVLDYDDIIYDDIITCFQPNNEFEKWRAIRASVGGVGGVLA